MSRYFNGRVIIFNEAETKYKAFSEFDCFWFKDIVDDGFMDDFHRNTDTDRWDMIISKLYGINLNPEKEDQKQINESLIKNAYILNKNDIRQLIETYEDILKKKNEEIELLKETITNQQSIGSYQDMVCELRSLNNDFQEINSKLFGLKSFEGMFNVFDCCYEDQELKKYYEVIKPYLIITVM